MKLIPCKHLDYTTKYGPDCELRDMSPHYPHVKYWHRGPIWTHDGGTAKVQFCGQGRGRINAVFDCYQEGCMRCYEPDTESSLEREP